MAPPLAPGSLEDGRRPDGTPEWLPAQRRCHPSTVPPAPVSVEVVIDDGGLDRARPHHRPDAALAPGGPARGRVLLLAQPDHPALPRGRWVVLRDFLRYGLDEPTGDGEVRIRPDPARATACCSSSPVRAGTPASRSPATTVLDFLEQTERAVPSGTERSEEAIDALLARLLGTEPPDG